MTLSTIRQATVRFLLVYVWLHVPLIAMLGGLLLTDWVMATMGAFVLATITTVQWRLSPDSSGTRLTLSVALMGMVAIIVDQLNGLDWQSDMHMYFFAALAMLTALCDWRALVAATGFVAVHHLALNVVYPFAVFPEGSSYGRVLLHAVIVLIEAGVLITLAAKLVQALTQAHESLQEARTSAIVAAEATAERDRLAIEAATARRAAMMALAGSFEASVMDVVGVVASSATEMHCTAKSMTQIAGESGEQATVVASAADAASGNVETVAAAAEELSSSIVEISRRAAETAQVASLAAERVAGTSGTAASLSAAADRIGEVVKLIDHIARQTNLLALNATIEASRAGEAGRGFAVVAGEVKTLALQTGQATGEITGQILAVQEETRKVVQSIGEISSVIEQVRHISAEIASAVEQQGSATKEIARNVEEASRGTHEVSENIGQVMQSSVSTSSAAEQVAQASSRLAHNSELLRGEVSRFLDQVRAA